MEDLKNALSGAENQTAEETKENKEEKAPEKVDYKAELEKAKSIIDHKENIIKSEKSKNEELKAKLTEAGFSPEEIQAHIKDTIASEVDGFRKSIVTDAIEDEIDNVSTSPDEAELIRFHLNNSVRLNGTGRKEIRNAVEAAKLLANKKKIMSTNIELAEALKSKATIRTAPDGAGEKVQPKQAESLNSEEQKLLKRFEDAAKKIVQDAPANTTK